MIEVRNEGFNQGRWRNCTSPKCGIRGSYGPSRPCGHGGSRNAAEVPTDALSVSSEPISSPKSRPSSRPSDVRADKVEAIRAQIDAETYHPDGEAVANGL